MNKKTHRRLDPGLKAKVAREGLRCEATVAAPAGQTEATSERLSSGFERARHSRSAHAHGSPIRR
jgi:hypothetical protein